MFQRKNYSVCTKAVFSFYSTPFSFLVYGKRSFPFCTRDILIERKTAADRIVIQASNPPIEKNWYPTLISQVPIAILSNIR